MVWLGISGDDGVRAVMGAASKRVAAIEVEQAVQKWTVPVDSPCGAFVVGIESPGSATMRAIDEHGDVLPAADGEPAAIEI